MLKYLIRTGDDISMLILRIILGCVFFPHGAQKLLGWFAGYGFSGTIGFFTKTMHISYPLAVIEIITEFFAPIALIFGFFTRAASMGIGVIMIVAIAMVHWRYGFFMNWSGTQHGEGIEYHLLVLAITAVLMIKGAGRWSVDRLISKHLS